MLRNAMLSVGAVMLLVACESTQDGPTTAPASMGMLNENCPVMGEPVDANGETVEYAGYKIGFCCAGCIGKWKGMTDAEKQAYVASQLD